MSRRSSARLASVGGGREAEGGLLRIYTSKPIRAINDDLLAYEPRDEKKKKKRVHELLLCDVLWKEKAYKKELKTARQGSSKDSLLLQPPSIIIAITIKILTLT